MRKRETIKIDDREITIKELTVKQIIEIGDKVANPGERKNGDSDLDLLKDAFKQHLALGVDGIVFDELLSLAPSELKTIYDTFKEVNAVFFGIAQQIGFLDLLQKIKLELQSNFLRSLAG